MAWRSSGVSNKSLIENLFKNKVITKDKVKQAMLNTDRAHYTVSEHSSHQDSPQYLGYGATISAPHMHAYALEILHDQILRPNSRILDVGCGSGYLLAAFKRMNPSSEVIGIEHIPQLVEFATKNLTQDDNILQQVTLICGDGRISNPEITGQFDVIHVGAAAGTMPQYLVDILAPNGRMIIPVGGSDYQNYERVDKNSEGEVTVTNMMGVMYVPLTSVEHQLSRHVD